MHFASFVINLLSWAFIGIGFGFFLHKGVRIKQNGSIFIGALASLAGGIFSSMTNGFPDVGVDFFNLFVASLFSLAALYIFAPNTRSSIVSAGSEIFDKSKEFVSAISEERNVKSPYFNSHFWQNITSTLG